MDISYKPETSLTDAWMTPSHVALLSVLEVLVPTRIPLVNYNHTIKTLVYHYKFDHKIMTTPDFVCVYMVYRLH